ncbi:uncharacterized protein LOC141898945 [Tubulanus polymorphus]|uniref:uncharacterized protein LOC141898945 n=2 Tax=Tubulanus polymorphus TaxID=672921 RepID=UPI003DA28F45
MIIQFELVILKMATCSNEKQLKKRSPNFTKDEMAVLTDVVMKNGDVLFSKLNNDVTNKLKAKKWGEVASAVNSLGHCVRKPDELKFKWKNMSAKAKCMNSERRKLAHKTGGGPPPENLIKNVDETMEKIISANENREAWVGIDATLDLDPPIIMSLSPEVSKIETLPSNPITLMGDDGTVYEVTESFLPLPATETNVSEMHVQDISTSDNIGTIPNTEKAKKRRYTQQDLLNEQVNYMKVKAKKVEMEMRLLELKIKKLEKEE